MQTINKLIETIDTAIDKFNSSIPSLQKRIDSELRILVKDLDTKGDNIVQSVSNLRKLAKIQKALQDILNTPEYIDAVKEFANSFKEVETLNNTYFREVSKSYSPNDFLVELRKQSVQTAVESLTGSGINQNVTSKLSDLIFESIKTGSSYNKLLDNLRSNVLTDANGVGQLERYARQITTDSLNQFNASYQDNVTQDLGLEWYMYTGALIDTSRDFCKACVEKKYIHKSELDSVVKGDFAEFKKIDGKINPKTKLPYGMIDGTNSVNVVIRRGGYGCGHKMIAVSSLAVPKELRMKFEK